MEDAARLLVDSGVRLVGVDAMSVDPLESCSFPAHHILLNAGVIILEGLDLSAAPPGDYELLCLPLKIRHGMGRRRGWCCGRGLAKRAASQLCTGRFHRFRMTDAQSMAILV